MKIKETYFALLMLAGLVVNAQKLQKDKNYFISAIGFWNVENLYDTLNDKWKNDEDFTPEGVNAWNGSRYRTKIDHLAEVISQMATQVNPDGLAILGMCEIENKNVLLDLVNSPKLKKRNYQIIHIEGPDSRGVDPSLIYNPTYFKASKAVSYRVNIEHKTRDILVVSGLFDGEELAVLVNHWPSRRGGELASRSNRNAAAKLARHIADSISFEKKESKIIIMGDFNDDPINECIKKFVGTYDDITNISDAKFYNPMEQLFKKGIGTLAYKDSWNLFDQILLNKNWIGNGFKTWQFSSVRVYNKSFLRNDFGSFKGYPFRTYSGGSYTAGYSDHFPVFISIAKEKMQ